MLSIERVMELLKDETLSVREAEEIRDSLRLLAEVIFDKWSMERNASDNNKSQSN